MKTTLLLVLILLLSGCATTSSTELKNKWIGYQATSPVGGKDFGRDYDECATKALAIIEPIAESCNREYNSFIVAISAVSVVNMLVGFPWLNDKIITAMGKSEMNSEEAQKCNKKMKESDQVYAECMEEKGWNIVLPHYPTID